MPNKTTPIRMQNTRFQSLQARMMDTRLEIADAELDRVEIGYPSGHTEAERRRQQSAALRRVLERGNTPADTAMLRWIAGLMGLWTLCSHRACRRASRCRGAPSVCFSHYAWQVSPDVRAGVEAMLRYLRKRATPDAVLALAPTDAAGLEAWLANPTTPARIAIDLVSIDATPP
jgi:hypothetical protein